jgi:hypothetical protein
VPGYLQLLDTHGVECVELRSADPGRVVYEDDVQVVVTPYGGVDADRMTKAIDQIGLTYEFKNTKPKAADAFDSSFLPSAADRKAN